jgi:basic amino acid/polyamine antiporter, APA family
VQEAAPIVIICKMLKKFFRKKTLADVNELGPVDSGAHVALNKILTTRDLTALGVAAIIGAGVFSTIGRACFHGGPAVSLLFVFTAITCAFCAFCYAEFASRVPIAGSAYTYAYVAFGELIAWIIGWNLILEYAIGNITVAIAWSSNLTNFLSGLGIKLPSFLSNSYLAALDAHKEYIQLSQKGVELMPHHVEILNQVWHTAPKIFGIPFILNLPAFFSVVAITALVYVGVKESKNTTIFMVIFKVLVVVLVIVVGAFYVNPENWSPFAPNGLTGVLQGVSAVFFAYVGFDAVSTTAEECKNPQKDLPQGMINSLLICTTLYIGISVVLTGMVKYTKLNVGDFLAVAFQEVGLHWLGGILALSAVIATTSVMLVFQFAQPRIWMAISRDGLLPAKFSYIHPKFRTPSFATIIMGCMVAIPALILDSKLATDMNSIGTLFAFASVCMGILFLPREGTHGKFMVPFINGRYVIPLLLVIGSLIMLAYNPKFFSEFFSLSDPELSQAAVLNQKIPYFVFFAILSLMTILSAIKKLSVIPVLGFLSCCYLMTELGLANWQRFIVWMFLGLIIYLAYGFRNSRMAKVKEFSQAL